VIEGYRVALAWAREALEANWLSMGW